MRVVLFRGKRTDNGEWAFGYYSYNRFTKTAEIYSFDSVRGYVYTVIPETVGQYTGLIDKNSKMIFEDDIVKIKGKTRYIFYGSSGFRHTNYGEYADTLENVFTVVDCEVIGNKIDNPELLRGDRK